MKIKQQRPQGGRIRAAIRSWLGVPFGLTDDDAWAHVAGRDTPAGVVVTPETMLTYSAVWACVRLIAETIGTLPLSIYERTSAGKRVAAQHPVQFIIHDQPNTETTAAVFWESLVAAMLMRGTGRCERLMVGSRLVGLAFLAPARLNVSKDGQGNKIYRYTNDNGTQRVIPRERIWEVPGFSLDGKTGVPVIRYMARTIGSALAADDASAKVWRSGLKPTRYLKLKDWLTKRQRAEYKEAIDDVKNAVDKGDVPVLEGGMEFGTIGFDPGDAELLASRSWNVEEACRLFRVDPSMVGHGGKDSNWGTGLEQKMIWFLTFTLAPWLKRIEQYINKDLLAPGERARFYSKFNVEGLLRADSAARASFYAVMVNNGCMTRNQVRELEDWPLLGGNAAKLTVQSAMTLIDSLGTGTPDAAQQARAAFRAFLGIPDDAPAPALTD